MQVIGNLSLEIFEYGNSQNLSALLRGTFVNLLGYLSW